MLEKEQIELLKELAQAARDAMVYTDDPDLHETKCQEARFYTGQIIEKLNRWTKGGE